MAGQAPDQDLEGGLQSSSTSLLKGEIKIILSVLALKAIVLFFLHGCLT